MKTDKKLAELKPAKPKFIKKPYMGFDPYVWSMAINRTFPEKEVIADGDRWNSVGEEFKDICESLYREGYRIKEEQVNSQTINAGGITIELPIRTVYILKK